MHYLFLFFRKISMSFFIVAVMIASISSIPVGKKLHDSIQREEIKKREWVAEHLPEKGEKMKKDDIFIVHGDLELNKVGSEKHSHTYSLVDSRCTIKLVRQCYPVCWGSKPNQKCVQNCFPVRQEICKSIA